MIVCAIHPKVCILGYFLEAKDKRQYNSKPIQITRPEKDVDACFHQPAEEARSEHFP